MLGHIAIAALGGYYSQDEESGAVVDTYIPASCVQVKGPHSIEREIPPSEAVFEKIFDETYLYAKTEFTIPYASVQFPYIALLGCRRISAGTRTYWYAGGSTQGGRRFCLYINETLRSGGTYSASAGPIVVWTEPNNRTANMIVRGTHLTGAPARYSSIESLPSFLSTSLEDAAFVGNFYVAALRNPYYHTEWVWMPLRSCSSAATALFEHYNPTLMEL